MHKVIVFTDIHIRDQGGTIIGLDPVARFTQGLAHALAHHPDASHIVISGDLTHHGTTAQYQQVQECLTGCPLPVSLMLGNHDRRAAFVGVFDDAPLTDQGFVQHSVDLGDTKLVMLDTLDEDAPDLHSGYLCAHRLDWLDAQLSDAARAGQRAIVFTHHPAILTGFRGMDNITLRNRAELVERLNASGVAVQMIAGHVHRTISGSVGGIPVALFKGTCHQMPMVLEDEGTYASVDEPAAYGLLLLHSEGVIVHTEDYTLPEGQIDYRESDPLSRP